MEGNCRPERLCRDTKIPHPRPPFTKKGFSQFVRDVSTWPFTVKLPFECNFDAIQKPMTSGKLDGMPDSWGSQGAHEQMVKLGKALLEELEKEGQ